MAHSTPQHGCNRIYPPITLEAGTEIVTMKNPAMKKNYRFLWVKFWKWDWWGKGQARFMLMVFGENNGILFIFLFALPQQLGKLCAFTMFAVLFCWVFCPFLYCLPFSNYLEEFCMRNYEGYEARGLILYTTNTSPRLPVSLTLFMGSLITLTFRHLI